MSERTIDGVAAGLGGSAGRIRGRPACATTVTRSSARRPPARWPMGSRRAGLARRGSGGTSFVAPSFNQLYFPGFGNPDLQPEEGRHGEVSLRWAVAGQEVARPIRQPHPRLHHQGPAPVNIPRARIDGVSLSYQAQLPRLDAGGVGRPPQPAQRHRGQRRLRQPAAAPLQEQRQGAGRPEPGRLALRRHLHRPSTSATTTPPTRCGWAATARSTCAPTGALRRAGRSACALNNVAGKARPDRLRLQPAGARGLPHAALRRLLRRRVREPVVGAGMAGQSRPAGRRARHRAGAA